MADVFIAHDQMLNRQVAVKVLHGQYATSETFIERFRREAQAAANLSHPNIVNIYDWGTDRGIYYMVMELIEGQDLRTMLRAEGPFMPHRVAEIGIDVAAALSAAHERGLVHRDIKPANVLVTADGTIKVTDFGIARAWDDSEQLTRTGAVIGTATYFSPEQAQGMSADARSDLYALGVVMYELLTGVPPFSGETPVAVAYQHVQNEAAPPSSLNPNIPAYLDAIVMKCLAKLPEDRYQSANELSADLQRFLAGNAPLAPPPGEAPTRLLTAPGTTPPQTMTGPQQPPPGTTGPPDRSTLVIGILAAVALVGLGLILLIRVLTPDRAPAEVTIPNLYLWERTDAITALEDLGLVVDERQVPDPEVPIDHVIRTDPAAGDNAFEGDTVILYVSTGPGEVEVPNVVGLLEEDARALIEYEGLIVGTVTQEPDEDAEVGEVLSQDPAAGEIVEGGSAVDLVVAADPDAIEIPDVTNRTEADALRVLEQAGFTNVDVDTEPSGEIDEGRVIETDPPAGTLHPPDDLLKVIVSEGAVPTVVPSVLGMDPDDAELLLEDLGFEVTYGDTVDLEYGDPNDGKVAEQDPSGGATVPYGSTITLRVGSSSETIPVPNVIGMTAAEARTAIEDVGLEYHRGSDRLVDPDTQGYLIDRVASVNPAVGTELNPNDMVTVRIGVAGAKVPTVAGTDPVTPPVCMLPDDAEDAIKAAGLVYFLEPEPDLTLPVGDPCDGRIIEQLPGPFSITGSLVNRESQVRVRIGRAMVEVPDLIGETEANAIYILQNLELVPVTDCMVGTVGQVLDQDPLPAEGPVEIGTEVTIWIGAASCPP
jgi:beta-lactam-binding protein with PASTA domain